MKQIYTLKGFSKNLGIFMIMLFLMGSAPLVSFAQSEPVIATDWTALPEAEYMLDVTYRVIDCNGDGAFELQLHLFNENMEKTAVSFTIKISDEATEGFFEYRVVDFPIAFGDMLSADCGSDDFAKLKVAIPEGFSPDNLKVEIFYH